MNLLNSPPPITLTVSGGSGLQGRAQGWWARMGDRQSAVLVDAASSSEKVFRCNGAGKFEDRVWKTESLGQGGEGKMWRIRS